jgi:hypothetical protein
VASRIFAAARSSLVGGQSAGVTPADIALALARYASAHEWRFLRYGGHLVAPGCRAASSSPRAIAHEVAARRPVRAGRRPPVVVRRRPGAGWARYMGLGTCVR